MAQSVTGGRIFVSQRPDFSSSRDRGPERGVALLTAIVVAILLTVIGISLTRSSMTEYQMSSEFEAHEQALIVADAGFNVTKDGLRGKDLSTQLAALTHVPAYLEVESPPVGSPAERNPITPYEARNIDYENAPHSVGNRDLFGFLTAGTGVPLGKGRYFARLSDNHDEAPLGLTENSRVDRDYTVFLRVLGVYPASISEVNTIGSVRKNSVAILEGQLRRDLSFDLASPLTIYGPDVNAAFDGNAFDVIGNSQHPAITVLNDDPANGDATKAYQSLLKLLGKTKGNVEGVKGPDGISLLDGTAAIRGSTNPDAINVFDPAFMSRFVAFAATVADNLYTNDAHLSGQGVNFGSIDNPKITVALGDLTLTGNGTGAGILIVKGAFELGGAFDFDGLVLVLGKGDVWLHGANKNLTGGVYVANVQNDRNGVPAFGTPGVRVSGNSNFIFNSDRLKMAINLLPMRTMSIREITPDLDAGTVKGPQK